MEYNSSIYFAHHLGLGDAIVCAPMIATTAKLYPRTEIIVPCKAENEESVKSFYSAFENITTTITDVHRIANDANKQKDVIRIGIYGEKYPGIISWNEYFFWQYSRIQDLPVKSFFDSRFDYCPLQKASEKVEQLPVPKGDYIIIQHDGLGRAIKIDENGITSKGQKILTYHSGSILGWADLLANAKEIHCFDSAFLHLSEALNTTGKLFYHFYAAPSSWNYRFRKDWIILR
jgi:hypothetical protein